MSEAAGAGPERGAAIAELAAGIARRLAPADDPPSDGPAGELWRALVTVVDRIYGSGVHPLGRLPFIGERLHTGLVREAHEQLGELPDRGERASAPPGPMLRRLAVSRQLREAVTAATGFPVVPSYEACHLYDPPSSHVTTHIDARSYELIVHLVLEHTRPRTGGRGSALVVHLPGARGPARVAVPAGEAVVLHGRGTLHSWEPLAGEERRILVGIGFQRAVASSATERDGLA